MAGRRSTEGALACPYCSTKAVRRLMLRTDVSGWPSLVPGPEAQGRDLPVLGPYTRWDCPRCAYAEIEAPAPGERREQP